MSTVNDEVLKNDPILSEAIRRLVDAFAPERIYLFGSRARGEAGSDSDYDLMVVIEESSEPGYRLAARAHSLLWGLKAAADILVWPRKRFEERLSVRVSLPATIVREGKLLYAV